MGKFLRNLGREVSRRGLLGTLMAWHRGYLRPGVNYTLVGIDQAGNHYYESKELPFGQDRWVEYTKAQGWGHDYDASQVPPAWHGWLHHVHDAPNSQAPVYGKPHRENKTGTAEAYHPHNYVEGPHLKTALQPNFEEWDYEQPSPFKEAAEVK